MNSKKRISLVIGSGGIKCAAAAGLWRVLKLRILKWIAWSVAVVEVCMPVDRKPCP